MNMKFKRVMLLATLLVMTLSAVTGGTIAWFTDNVTSANNVITSGNLDVELEYSKDFQNWNTVEGKSDLFSDHLWEPGYTEVVYLRLTNKGNLAIKYALNMLFTETEGTNVYGETFKLSNSLKYAVVDANAAYATRDAARSAAEASAVTLSAYKGTGIMTEQNDFATVALVVYMPEEVGNEANAKTGTAAPVINLGIKLEAFQKDSEVDAFGPDYDLESSEQIITTADGLQLLQDAVEHDRLYLYLVPEDYAGDTVIVPEGVTDIGNYAFAYNNNVKTVILPSTVTNLGRGFDSSTVEKVVLNEGLTTISSRAFRRTYDLKEVVIPSTVTTVADNAFQSSGIKHIVFPESVTSIGDSCFTGSTVESVVIAGKNVRIDRFAFRDCPNLTSVTILADEITLGDGMIFTPSQHNNLNPNGITIYTYSQQVANAIKANGTFKGTIEMLTAPSTAAELKTALSDAQPGQALRVEAGTYGTLPSSSFKAGVTLYCEEGVVFSGKSGLNIQGATVVGATFSNPSGSAVSGTINGTFKDCTFTGSNGLRECYVGETTVFENCVFSGDVYGMHFDGSSKTITFKNCTFSGFNATAAAIKLVTFEGCTFVGNGKSAYNGLNLWGNGDFKDCTFIFDGSTANEWIDLRGENKTATFTNCVVKDGSTTKSVAEVVRKSYDSSVIIIDGTVFIPQ